VSVHVGDQFRQYRVVERIGEGGMGVVYRAHDTTLDRDVALKFVTGSSDTTREHSDRWRQEARALAALNHPNIVTIYEIGDADGLPFLALEWVGGGSFASTALERPLGMEAFARLALPVADALAAAHDRGIIHRDVKPANVLVGADGRVKLADFGLARFGGGNDVTEAGDLLGTVAYMSPEQAAGATLTPATDVFSFGVLAYELLAGVRPFQGSQPGEVLAAILADRRAPLRDVWPDVPASLAAVVDDCLAHEPAGRLASGAELARALRRALADTDRSTSGAAASRPPAPSGQTGALEQHIRFTTTSDGVSLAYATIGSGPAIVRVLGHFTHLEVEWEWPDLRRFWECLARRHTVVRYDGRGMGLSDRFAGEFTEETRQQDLEAVVDALGARKVVLLGISEGGWTAAQYAVAHPDRVTRLVLYGAYCRGARARPGYDAEEDEALVTLIRKGWGRDTPAIRQVMTSRFFREDADPRLVAHFNALQRVSAEPDTAARYYAALHTRGDGRDLFRRVTVPTLVVHCREDLAVSVEEGRLLASTVPGAELVMLPSGTHYFPTDADVAVKAAGAIERFVVDKGVE
jgi:pimeloyl-ACP methyl ester carboxylesterase